MKDTIPCPLQNCTVRRKIRHTYHFFKEIVTTVMLCAYIEQLPAGKSLYKSVHIYQRRWYTYIRFSATYHNVLIRIYDRHFCLGLFKATAKYLFQFHTGEASPFLKAEVSMKGPLTNK